MPFSEVSPTLPARALSDRLERRARGQAILVSGESVTDDVHDLLRQALLRTSTACGSASPVPSRATNALRPVVYAPAPDLVPATVPLPCGELCLLDGEALDALGTDLPEPLGTTADHVVAIGARLTRMGYRHVVAPGLAYQWQADSLDIDEPTAAWSSAYVRELGGSANVLLGTHRLWADTRLRPVRLVIDGACITPDVHTGTQRLVIEIARWMNVVQPTASVTLAVRPASVAAAEAELIGTSVSVVVRDSRLAHQDVAYRPYQMLRADELPWCLDVADRLIVGQLDMIGFSNPFYHPSTELFFLARNLQRKMMRDADAVTFISESGRSAAMSECPHLDRRRTHVVWCGADADPQPGVRPASFVEDGQGFLLCLSATFWHKHRRHAVETFVEMARVHGYAGRLVIAGPEPFYGRSVEAETAVLSTLPADLADRVVHLGQVAEAEKWFLLREASAVLYPSVVEGFGLVPFEAASVDTPTLSYLGTAVGEVLGEGEATISSWSNRAWADKISGWLVPGGLREAALAHVRAAAERFTWERCAQLTWAAVDGALSTVPPAVPIEEGRVVAHLEPSARRVPRTIRQRMFLARVPPAMIRRAKQLTRRSA